MEGRIETRAAPERVWAAWEGARSGQTHKGLKYKVLNIVPEKEFTVLWKTLFIHLYFTHTLSPSRKGSLIGYTVKIKGLFAWPIRLMLGNKIKRNIDLVLKSMVKQLET